MSNELKGVSGIDKAVNAIMADVEERKAAMVEEITALAKVVTTDETLPARKADRASVNKMRTAFDRERIDFEKKWKSAVAPVSDAYKACVAECDKVIAAIDEDLKSFEEKRIDEKNTLIYETYNSIEEPDGIVGWLELDDLFNKKWLNVSYTEKQIRKDMEDAFAALKISYDTVVSLNHKYQEEGLKVLRETKSLQEAIAKMNSLADQERIIEERRKAEEARKAAEKERLEAEEEARKAEEARKVEELKAQLSEGKIPYKKPEILDAPPVSDNPFGEPEEDIPLTPFGTADMPFGVPVEDTERKYVVHVTVNGYRDLCAFEGMLIGLYEYNIEEV